MFRVARVLGGVRRERDVDVTTDYEAVIGLEVHCELSTATKLFCGCANEFGAEPNTHVCPVCLGLPGSLPVLNEQAVEFALRFAEAVHLRVPEQSIFARKNYFYPDMPKDYQISQYDEPITVDGWIEIDGARVGIERAHLEEDTGKTAARRWRRSHPRGRPLARRLQPRRRPAHGDREPSRHPQRRAGARVRVASCAAVLQAIGVSDVKMEEGSMRVDANVSVRPVRHHRARHQGRGQEHELAAVARARDRLRDRAADRRARGGRADRAGDASLGRSRRPHALDAHEGRLVRLPLLPRARPRAGGAHRRDAGRGARVDARAAGGAAGPARRGVGDRATSDGSRARRHARAGRLRRGGGGWRSTAARRTTS